MGIAATQIAKRQGAEVYGTASPGKHEAIRGFGVDHPLDYTQAGWERDLPQFDVIMDAIGGKSFRTGYDLLRPAGGSSASAPRPCRRARGATSWRRWGRSCACRGST